MSKGRRALILGVAGLFISTPENRDRIQPSTSRTGGVGFGLTPGSKADISKLGLKVLR
jgi:hypothetical protein